MFELTPERFKQVLPLYKRELQRFPLILAVIQGKQPGWVFVDNPSYPAAAWVITRFGFLQAVGEFTTDDSWVSFFQYPPPHLPNYLLWYAPPSHMQTLLNANLGAIRCRERMRFAWRQEPQTAPPLPAGFAVRPFDQQLIHKTEHFKLEIASRFWTSAADFLKHGLGFCVVHGEEVVSLCYAACVVDGLAEVDVMTSEPYRGLGLAAGVAQPFILECLRRKITPTWDCFTNNAASMNLAVKLGFEQAFSYPFYSFNTPLQVGGLGLRASRP